MIKVIALLNVDEEQVKTNNMMDLGTDINDDEFGDALISEMAPLIISSGIAMEDYKIIIDSQEELSKYKGNKAVVLKKYIPNQLQKLDIINFSDNDLAKFSQ